MLDVMSIRVPLVRAAREAAALVTRIERTLNRGRDAASLPSNAQRLALLVLDDRYHAGVASQAAGRFSGDGGALFDLAALIDTRAQRFS